MAGHVEGRGKVHTHYLNKTDNMCRLLVCVSISSPHTHTHTHTHTHLPSSTTFMSVCSLCVFLISVLLFFATTQHDGKAHVIQRTWTLSTQAQITITNTLIIVCSGRSCALPETEPLHSSG